MRAKMLTRHKAARFGPHQLEIDQVIVTEEADLRVGPGERAQLVSRAEMVHHLEAGHAKAIKAPRAEVAKPAAPEKAVERPPRNSRIRRKKPVKKR